MDDAEHAFVSVAEAAVRLGRTTSRVRQMLRDRELAGYKPMGAKLWLVDVTSLEACRR